MKLITNTILITALTNLKRAWPTGLYVLLGLCMLQFLVTPPAHGATLSVETIPEGLPVILDGQEVGEAPKDVTLSSGKHNLKVKHEKRSWSGLIQLTGDAEMTISFSEKSIGAPYRTVILSRPAEARVIVDGEPRGRTPWTGELSAGEHTVKLLKEGFGEWIARLTPSSNFSLRGILTRKESRESAPPEAHPDLLTKVMPAPENTDDETDDNLKKVMGGNTDQDFWKSSVGGEERKTQLTQTASTAQKQQSAVKRYLDDKTVTHEPPSVFNPDQEPSAKTTKKESSSMEKGRTIPLKIWSKPSGARVIIDGEKVGNTPFIRRNYPAGKAVITLKKSGYNRWQDKFRLGRPTSLKISLQSQPTGVRFAGTPKDMKIRVNDTEFKLNQKSSMKLPPGTYDIQATASGYLDYKSTFELFPGEKKTISLSMKRNPQVQKFPSIRDVFLRLVRDSLGPVIEDLGIRRKTHVLLNPDRQDRAHTMIGSVLSRELNRKGAIVETGPSPSDLKLDKGIGGESYSAVGPWGRSSVDSVLEFRVKEMNVNYNSAGTAQDITWTNRNFTMELLVKLIDSDSGEVLLKRSLTRKTSDKVPTSLVEKLKGSFSSPADGSN